MGRNASSAHTLLLEGLMSTLAIRQVPAGQAFCSSLKTEYPAKDMSPEGVSRPKDLSSSIRSGAGSTWSLPNGGCGLSLGPAHGKTPNLPAPPPPPQTDKTPFTPPS